MKFSLFDYKSILKLFLKLLFAIAILYWLVSQNKLDYRLVTQSLKNPLLWFTCFLTFLFQIWLGAIRWRIVLNTNIKNILLNDIVRIQWIGQFFSVMLPGGIAGDLVKIGYMKTLKKETSKKFLFLTILVDRLAGLNALLLLAGITSLFYYNELITLNPLLKNIIYFNILLFIASCVAMILFFLNRNMQTKILNLTSSTKIKNFLNTIWSFSEFKKEILQVILISLLINAVTIVSFWLINFPFFERPIEFKYLMSLIPVGLVAVALPISPAGLGVGHMAFDKLFHLIGHNNGASLFNVWWVVMFISNLCGVLPFIFSKKNIELPTNKQKRTL